MKTWRWNFLFPLLLSCLTHSLPASEPLPEPSSIAPKGCKIDKEGKEAPPNVHLIYEFDPSEYLMGMVNLQNGMLTHTECDLAVEGEAALPFIRSYIGTSGDYQSELGLRGGSNYPFQVHTFLPDILGYEYGASLELSAGAYVAFKTKSPLHYQESPFQLCPEVIKEGMTNTSRGVISGQTHIKNYLLEMKPFKQCPESFHLAKGNGAKLIYKRRPYIDDKKSNVYYLDQETLPSGNQRQYTYDLSEERITEVKSLNRKGKVIRSLKRVDTKEVKRPYLSMENYQTQFQYVASNGQQADYELSHEWVLNTVYPYKEALLKKVTPADKPSYSYEYEKVSREGGVGQYRPHLSLLGRINRPEGRFLAFKYDKDYKVKQIRAPNSQGWEIDLYTIDYQPRINPYVMDQATVKSFDRVDTYFFDNKRLRFIHYNSKMLSKESSYCRQENFYWDETENSPTFGNLLCKALYEPVERKFHSGWRYTYDERHNLSEETFFGHLTGKDFSAIMLGDRTGDFGKRKPECFKKRSTYSKDGFNLKLTEQEDGGPLIAHSYYTGTNLLKSSLTSVEGRILRREFFHYNDDAVLTRQVVDDGSSDREDDLRDVKERRILEIKPVEDSSKPGFSLPEVVRTLYYDRLLGREVLLKELRHEYESKDRLKATKVCDANGALAYTLEFKYGAMGTLVEEKDAMGRVTKHQYDANKNCVRSELMGSKFYTQRVFDYNDRLITLEQVHQDGIRLKERFEYDTLGRKVASTNVFGQKTSYVYDSFGREMERKLPRVKSQGKEVLPTRKRGYNSAGHVVFEQDENGFSERIKRNSYGSPVEVTDKLGAKESFEYNLDGTLAKHTHKNGSYTTYSYDAFRRVLEERTFDAQNALIQAKSYTYDAFHLISEIDGIGKVTYYQYDGAGRKAAVIEDDGVKQRQTSYFYDALGRLFETKSWFDSGADDYISTKVSYDLLDRPILTEERDSSGILKKRERIAYDIVGNRIETAVDVEDGVSAVTHFTYNSRNELIAAIDPLGNQTRYLYDYTHKDEMGGCVLKKTTIDPKGTQQIDIFDALSRLVSSQVKNPLGVIVSESRYTYDLMGRPILETELVLDSNGQKIGEYSLLKEYGPAGHLKRLVEQPKSALKETKYLYNQWGQLETLIKPDRVQISHTYNAQGLVKEVKASDNSVHYRYSYDAVGHLIRSEDLVAGLTTERDYNRLGELTGEHLANGLSIAYGYDLLGRPSQITLPDGSGIGYVYSGPDLQEVRRLDASEVCLFSHAYQEINLRGQAKRAQLAGTGQEVRASYDLLGRVSAIEAPSWSLDIPAGGYDAAGYLKALSVSDPLGTAPYSFHYDSLYQMSEESGPFSHTYSYDSIRNRRKKDDADYQIGALNEVLGDAKSLFSYDVNGNLLLKEGADEEGHFTYDALNRLTSFEVAKSRRVEYGYDSFGRRLKKTIFSWDTGSGSWQLQGEDIFLYQGETELASYRDGALKELRFFGLSAGSNLSLPLWLEMEGQLLLPIHDQRGNLAALLDGTSGEMLEFYRTSAFGERLAYDEQGSLQSEELTPWGFSGKRLDEESGLIYFGQRYYDPELGRWLTPDSSGFSDGPNLYAYALNNPCRFFDAFGLSSDCFESNATCFESKSSCFEPLTRSINEAVERIQSEDLDLRRQPQVSYFENYEDLAAIVNHVLKDDLELLMKRSEIINGSNKEILRQGILYANGVNNSIADCKDNAKYIAKLARLKDIAAVYNKTHGIPLDLEESYLNLNYVATPPSLLLQELWDKCFEALPKDAFILQILHSQAAIHGRNALVDYPEHLRQRIMIVAIAPGAYIDPSMCKKVVHYRANYKRDPIPYVDIAGAEVAKDTIYTLESDPSISGIDHAFQSLTYKDPLKKHLKKYIKSGGTKIW